MSVAQAVSGNRDVSRRRRAIATKMAACADRRSGNAERQGRLLCTHRVLAVALAGLLAPGTAVCVPAARVELASTLYEGAAVVIHTGAGRMRVVGVVVGLIVVVVGLIGVGLIGVVVGTSERRGPGAAR